MSESRSVLLCGATGLVGRECLRLLFGDAAFGRIVVLTRRPLSSDSKRAAQGGAELEEHVVDFDHLDDHAAAFRVNVIISALGTTIKQAGSKERFRRVDYEYPVRIAQLGLAQGAQHFLLVSSIGASAHSRAFYLRVKGELEQSLRALPYRSLTILRPSLLLGERGEFRIGEEIGKRLAFLTPSKYRPVAAPAVAAALVQLAREDVGGQRILESAQIKAVAATYGGHARVKRGEGS